MNKNPEHISSYLLNGSILCILLIFTTLTVLLIHFHLGALTVALALLIAMLKGSLVITYFMHLKFEYFLLKALVIGVILFYFSIILVTFIDYLYRQPI
jgi:cytochrome c oxidase subunit IV